MKVPLQVLCCVLTDRRELARSASQAVLVPGCVLPVLLAAPGGDLPLPDHAAVRQACTLCVDFLRLPGSALFESIVAVFSFCSVCISPLWKDNRLKTDSICYLVFITFLSSV